MRLQRPDRRERGRIAVFVAVVGLHVLAALLLLTTGTVRFSRLHDDAPLALLQLPPQSTPRPVAASPASSPERNLKRRPVSPSAEPLPSPQVPEASNAITLPLDLRADADSIAQRQAEKEEKERRRANLAGPSDSQLEWWRNNVPLVRDHHQRGDSERAEGGELITWINDKCFYTNRGISTYGLPQTSKVCKDPPKTETDLFKDMRKKLDESAKGRIP
jgi:hypothetical protein